MPGTVSSESEMIRMIESGSPPKKPAMSASTSPMPTPTKPGDEADLERVADAEGHDRPQVAALGVGAQEVLRLGGRRGVVAPTLGHLRRRRPAARRSRTATIAVSISDADDELAGDPRIAQEPIAPAAVTAGGWAGGGSGRSSSVSDPRVQDGDDQVDDEDGDGRA